MEFVDIASGIRSWHVVTICAMAMVHWPFGYGEGFEGEIVSFRGCLDRIGALRVNRA